MRRWYEPSSPGGLEKADFKSTGRSKGFHDEGSLNHEGLCESKLVSSLVDSELLVAKVSA